MSRDALTHEPIAPERYELQQGVRYAFDLDRREFGGVLGAGLLVWLAATRAVAQERRGSRGVDGGLALGERLHIAVNGGVTVFTGKVDAGQGSRTQLMQAAAEELRVPPERIALVMADTEACPDDGGTWGSRTTPSTVPAVRRAAAAARELLLDLAAARWGVDRAGLVARDGAVTDGASRTIGYGELAVADAFRAAPVPRDDDEARLTPAAEWSILGAPLPNVRARAIVTGAKTFPSDTVRPGMLHGRVLRPPSWGATLAGIDLEAARRRPDVTVVRDGDFVGCAAPTAREAARAVEAIAATAVWRERTQPSSDQLFDHLKATAGEPRRSRDEQRGSLEQGRGAARTIVREAWRVAPIQHVPMEPRAAVAEWDDRGRLTVWTGSQAPQRVRSELVEAFRMSDGVRVIVPDTGGGFGGKHTGEAAVEAARLARAAGRPVSLRWTREEEFSWAYFRPPALIEIEAGVDGSGMLSLWDFTNYNAGSAGIGTPYAVPNARIRFRRSDSPLRQGSYRALAATANNFARESMIDELAEAAGEDPLGFRMRQLEPRRLRDVVARAAERFGWAERRARPAAGRGVGLACGAEKGSYVAACVEVEVDRTLGEYRVLEVCQAFECGAITNPLNLQAQVEGCIIMGLGGALREDVRFERGRVVDPTLGGYPVPRFADVPAIETVLVDRPDLPSVGGSETPIIAVAPAIANALHACTGTRIRAMPIRSDDLRAAGA
ncbi:MAG: xanthine dehydrogenase family protein molybdopterin-binding subunit [Planctomycetota bacterium]|jgi:isoquinoline 1-oxidoreductase